MHYLTGVAAYGHPPSSHLSHEGCGTAPVGGDQRQTHRHGLYVRPEVISGALHRTVSGLGASSHPVSPFMVDFKRPKYKNETVMRKVMDRLRLEDPVRSHLEIIDQDNASRLVGMTIAVVVR